MIYHLGKPNRDYGSPVYNSLAGGDRAFETLEFDNLQECITSSKECIHWVVGPHACRDFDPVCCHFLKLQKEYVKCRFELIEIQVCGSVNEFGVYAGNQKSYVWSQPRLHCISLASWRVLWVIELNCSQHVLNYLLVATSSTTTCRSG